MQVWRMSVFSCCEIQCLIFDDDEEQDCKRWNTITPHRSWDPLIPEIFLPGWLGRLRYSTGIMLSNARVLMKTYQLITSH